MNYFRELDRLAAKLQQRMRWYKILIKGDKELFPEEHRRTKQKIVLSYVFFFLLTLILPFFLLYIIRNMNLALNLTFSLVLFLSAATFLILALLVRNFMKKIIKLYPAGYNEKLYEINEHIAHTEIKSWITSKGITKEQIEIQLLPYLDKILVEKNKFSLKTLLYLVITSSALTVPIFFTNLMLTIINNTSNNSEETIHVFYLTVSIFLITFIGIFILINVLFSIFAPPFSERTYQTIQRLFWQEISSNKKKKFSRRGRRL